MNYEFEAVDVASIPSRRHGPRRGIWKSAVDRFLEGGAEAGCLALESRAEAHRCISAIGMYVGKHGLPLSTRVRGTRVYLLREEKGSGPAPLPATDHSSDVIEISRANLPSFHRDKDEDYAEYVIRSTAMKEELAGFQGAETAVSWDGVVTPHSWMDA